MVTFLLGALRQIHGVAPDSQPSSMPGNTVGDLSPMFGTEPAQ
jgi:hypothetical protein